MFFHENFYFEVCLYVTVLMCHSFPQVFCFVLVVGGALVTHFAALNATQLPRTAGSLAPK